MEAGTLRLVKTCHSHPEQYDGYVGTEKVAYLRLRHGEFYARYRDRTVYEAVVRGSGEFHDQDERDHHLHEAEREVMKAHRRWLKDKTGVDPKE